MMNNSFQKKLKAQAHGEHIPPGVVAHMVPPGVAEISRRSSRPGMVMRCEGVAMRAPFFAKQAAVCLHNR